LPINAREAKVSDLIELTQRTKNGDADLVRRYFGLTEGPQRVLDELTQAGQLVLGHRPSLAGFPHPVDDLVASKRLDDATTFHNDELHLLDRGETPLARRALAPPPDAAAVISRA
jgi:hypothetical protein